MTLFDIIRFIRIRLNKMQLSGVLCNCLNHIMLKERCENIAAIQVSPLDAIHLEPSHETFVKEEKFDLFHLD